MENDHLIKNVMAYCKTPNSHMNRTLWGIVSEVFRLSVEEAENLCERMGEDPDLIILADPDWSME